MKNVLIYSIPFGFGPTGKAIAIANEISSFAKVTIATFGHTLRIINSTNFSVVDCKSRNFSGWDTEIFRNVDVVISVMDLRLINYVAENFPAIETIFVDSLFWWRKSLEDIPFEKCDLFLLQTFPGVKENLKNVPVIYRDKFIEVSPILPEYELTPAKKIRDNKTILLHFGGVNSLIAEWEMYREYFEFLTGAIIDYLRRRNVKLVITGNFELMNHLEMCFSMDAWVEFDCLNNQDFHRKLISADAFITTCGIEATYEAFNHDVPTIFLAPVNSTQLYQLMAFLDLDFPVIISNTIISSFRKVIESSFEYASETLEIAKTLKLLLELPESKQKFIEKLDFFLGHILSASQSRQEMLAKQRIFAGRPVENWLEALFLFLNKPSELAEHKTNEKRTELLLR